MCGSFDRALEPGTVVHVGSDRIAELGAEDDDAFLTIQELNCSARTNFRSRRPAGERRPPDERGAARVFPPSTASP